LRKQSNYSAFGFIVTESGLFQFCLRQRDRILLNLYMFSRTLQQAQSSELNCYQANYLSFYSLQHVCHIYIYTALSSGDFVPDTTQKMILCLYLFIIHHLFQNRKTFFLK